MPNNQRTRLLINKYSQTKNKHRIMLDRVENGFLNVYAEENTMDVGEPPKVSFLEEMKRFNNTK